MGDSHSHMEVDSTHFIDFLKWRYRNVPQSKCGKFGIWTQKIFQIPSYFHHTNGLWMGFGESLKIPWGTMTTRGEGGEEVGKRTEFCVALCINQHHPTFTCFVSWVWVRMLWLQITDHLTKSLLNNKALLFHITKGLLVGNSIPELVISAGNWYHNFGLPSSKFLYLLPHGNKMAAAAPASHPC